MVTYSLDLLSEETFESVDHEHHISLELKKYIMYPQRLVLSSVSLAMQNIRDINRTMSNSDEDFVYSPTGLRLWNNLPIDELKLHVERFVVVLHLSEPGSIPSAGLLASIIDMVCMLSRSLMQLVLCEKIMLIYMHKIHLFTSLHLSYLLCKLLKFCKLYFLFIYCTSTKTFIRRLKVKILKLVIF